MGIAVRDYLQSTFGAPTGTDGGEVPNLTFRDQSGGWENWLKGGLDPQTMNALSGFGVTDPANQLDFMLPDPKKGSLMPDKSEIGGWMLALAPVAAAVAGAGAAGAGAAGAGGAGAALPAGMVEAGFGLDTGLGMMSAPQLSAAMNAGLAGGAGAAGSSGAGESVSGSYPPAPGELSNAAASYGASLPDGVRQALQLPSTPGTGAPGGGTPPATPGASPGAAAPSSPTATTPAGAPQGTTGFSFVDDLIKQMRANPLQALGLGMTAASLAGGIGSQRTPEQVGQLWQLGAQGQQTAQRLLEQARMGQLSGPQQASLDQTVQNTKSQIRQYFASIGMSDSTAARQAEAAVDREALAMKEQFLNQALTQGLNALGVASGPLSQAAQYTLGQDRNLQQAFGQFGQAIGNLFGRSAGTQTAQTPKPAGT